MIPALDKYGRSLLDDLFLTYYLKNSSMRTAIFILVLVVLFSCKQASVNYNFYPSSDELFDYSGRIDKLSDSSIALITSAASVGFTVVGDSANISLSCSGSSHNYISLVINAKYEGRLKLKANEQNFIPLKLPRSDTNHVKIYKATEANNGLVLFHGANAQKIVSSLEQQPYAIEFIGNSITCGMGADTTDIPCGLGEWFDQHNAYLAYGVQAAQSLNAAFILNSVSGIGMYRNWNDENVLQPIMPQVYENLYLNRDSTSKYDFSFRPDIISICLGTNDLSDGDGVKNRLPFNEEKFISNYTAFVQRISQHHPNAQIALLTSPMISVEKGEMLIQCLQKVKLNLEADVSISIFEFDSITPTGCSYHPLSSEHQQMAEQLVPFYKRLLDK